MFSIKDGKVVAKFDDGEVSLALDSVKVDRDMLALVALARVSRETVAGLATTDQPKAKAKLLARWKLWQDGKWESERAKAAGVTEEERFAIAIEVLEYRFKAAGLSAADIAKAKSLIAKGDKVALAKIAKFILDNKKTINQRVKEVLKARKEKDSLVF